MKNRAGSQTRQRVLESACAVFAEKGFRDATVAEICEGAAANVAAVNYHFGDKETLYVEAMRHAFEITIERFPLDGGLADGASAEEHLRTHIDACLRRIFCQDEASYFPRMLVKELAEPTHTCGATLHELIDIHRAHLKPAIEELLGGAADRGHVRLCALSIISQFHFFGFNEAMRQEYLRDDRMTEERLAALIDHVTQFSMAGLREMRTRIEAGGQPSPFADLPQCCPSRKGGGPTAEEKERE